MHTNDAVGRVRIGKPIFKHKHSGNHTNRKMQIFMYR